MPTLHKPRLESSLLFNKFSSDLKLMRLPDLKNPRSLHMYALELGRHRKTYQFFHTPAVLYSRVDVAGKILNRRSSVFTWLYRSGCEVHCEVIPRRLNCSDRCECVCPGNMVLGAGKALLRRHRQTEVHMRVIGIRCASVRVFMFLCNLTNVIKEELRGFVLFCAPKKQGIANRVASSRIRCT